MRLQFDTLTEKTEKFILLSRINKENKRKSKSLFIFQRAVAGVNTV